MSDFNNPEKKESGSIVPVGNPDKSDLSGKTEKVSTEVNTALSVAGEMDLPEELKGFPARMEEIRSFLDDLPKKDPPVNNTKFSGESLGEDNFHLLLHAVKHILGELRQEIETKIANGESDEDIKMSLAIDVDNYAAIYFPICWDKKEVWDSFFKELGEYDVQILSLMDKWRELGGMWTEADFQIKEYPDCGNLIKKITNLQSKLINCFVPWLPYFAEKIEEKGIDLKK
ncbi:hypothetical protein K9M41_01065 [Candidatus Gracilibacteria bacterium]|nr:hypothetical protein [Candidatus Gracilibacteria bacterium]